MTPFAVQRREISMKGGRSIYWGKGEKSNIIPDLYETVFSLIVQL
jgi:hypothetical protein